MVIKGGCLCGKVRYKIIGSLYTATHYRCSMCRRQHGAAFATYAKINPDDLEWDSGEDFVKIYEPPTGDGWCFCSECGSSLAGSSDGEINSIALGTVEGDPGVAPEAHIFVGSKARWYKITDSLPRYDMSIRD